MYYVYILYSPGKNRYYVGSTIDVHGRLDQHNLHYYSGASTRIADDWHLYLSVECETKSQALKLEKFIKKMRNREFYMRMKNDEELRKSLLHRFL